MLITTQRSVYLVPDQIVQHHDRQLHKLDPATGNHSHVGSVDQNSIESIGIGGKLKFTSIEGKSGTTSPITWITR